jgi:hypothetical protein
MEAVMIFRLKNGVFGTALAMAVILFGCEFAAAQDIKTNYVPGTDFSKYKTYKWVNIAGPRSPIRS